MALDFLMNIHKNISLPYVGINKLDELYNFW